MATRSLWGLRTALAACAALAAAASAAAQTPARDALPLKPERTLTLNVSGGTWMSLDVSPDSRSLVFDMLGDLYALPVGGGGAVQITRGLAFDSQPVFSPDGAWIAFASDRSGSENLWIAKPDGSEARQVTRFHDDTMMVSPEWSADGKALFASRYRADINNFELWRFGLDGSQTLLVPIKPSPTAPRSAWRSTLGASASRDGRYLYFARRVGGLDYDEMDAWTVVRRDLASGEETPIIVGSGGRGASHETNFRPRVSPDGRRLAYASRRENRTELRIRDLTTGEDRFLAVLDPDQLQTLSLQDLTPRYAFTPDGAALMISRGNRIERLDLATGQTTQAPFTAQMQVDVGPSTRQQIREATGPVRARLAQQAIASPDGVRVAFSALGQVYVQKLGAKGPPHRIGPGYHPSWSPDGRSVVFVSWSEAESGAVWRAPADGGVAPARISDIGAFYTYPVFTPDGAKVLVLRSPAAARQHTSFESGKRRNGELVALPASGGAATVVTRGDLGGRPHYSRAEPGSVLMGRNDGLVRIDLQSGRQTLIASVEGAGYYFIEGSVPVDDLKLSPDGHWLLALVAQQVWLMPRPLPGATIDLDKPGSGARRLTDVGADSMDWSAGGHIDLVTGSRFQSLPGPVDMPAGSGAVQPLKQVALTVAVPRDRPHGLLLLRGARALTMANGDQIIPDADILIRDDRIAAIGPRGSFPVPAGAQVRELGGVIVLPGFVDEHDHIGDIRRDVLSLDSWGLKARLAYGVTTSFDPSTLSLDMLAYQDLLDAGLMVGPRLRSTGMALFSMTRFTSLDETRAALRRYRDDYGLTNIKEYRTGDRRVREWVAMAAKELGLQPTTEGALAMKLDLSQMIDGFAGHEHALPAAPLGPDVIGLMTAMRTSYATTFMVTNSGPPGADWFVAADNAQADPKIRYFWPPWAIDQKLVRRPWRPLDEYRFKVIAPGAAALARAGGLVGMGAHGEVPGVGFHWEMQAHVMGGMAPMAVLHAATAGSAETIGRLQDLGTLEAGKLADLIVLAKDPVADIRNSQSILEVMRGGRFYEAATLDEVWPEQKPLPAPAFASGDGRETWTPAPRSP